jgi:hypothetical protein
MNMASDPKIAGLAFGAGVDGGHADAAAASATPTHGAELIVGIKERLSALHAHDVELGMEQRELQAELERVGAKREVVRAEMASAENELGALVNAPVSGGRNPFEWLPDELIMMIMLMLPFEVLNGGQRTKRGGSSHGSSWATLNMCVLSQWVWMARCTLGRTTRPSECGMVKMERTSTPLWGTRAGSPLSQWGLMARCTLGRRT